MSHFAVAVFTKAADDVAKALQPYHEFECDGNDDQYVEDVDLTADLRESYKTATRRRLRTESGDLLDPYADKFYRDPTPEELEKNHPMMGMGCGGGISWCSKDWGDGKGYRAKVHFVPEELTEVDVPVREFMSFREFVAYEHGEDREVRAEADIDTEGSHKFGYTLLSGEEVVRVIDRTNPNAKWDWWQIGPGYSDRLLLKSGKRCNSARKGDVDIEALRAEKIKEAEDVYDKVRSVIGQDSQWDTWAVVREGRDVAEAREVYGAQQAVIAFQQNRDLFGYALDEFRVSREEYVAAAAKRPLLMFAALYDGKWYARGEMGWWAAVSDEMLDWPEQFNRLWASVPDDYVVTIVDCHI